MASAEVPDIRPRTRDDLGGIWALERRFHHRGHREHREEKPGAKKKITRPSMLRVKRRRVRCDSQRDRRTAKNGGARGHEKCFFRSGRQLKASRGGKCGRRGAWSISRTGQA